MTTTTTAVAFPQADPNVLQNALSIFQDSGSILQENIDRRNRAIAFGQALKAEWEANGRKLTPELDKKLETYIVKANTAKGEMEDKRKVLTQAMDYFRKGFTTVEKDLDVKNPEGIVYELQQARNQYAQELLAEKRRQEEEAARRAERNQEAISIKSEVERRMARHYLDAIAAAKDGMLKYFNSATLNTFVKVHDDLFNYKPNFDKVAPFYHGITSTVFLQQELAEMIAPIVAEKLPEYQALYANELSAYCESLVDQMHSKYQELEAMAKANAEELRRLEAERIKREAEESERNRIAAAERAAEEQRRIEAQKQAAETQNLFDQTAELTAMTPAPEARTGYEIEVTDARGYAEIFQFWFVKEAGNLTIEKIGNTKLDQMKAYAEKVAHKTGEKISSKYLVYRETVKAVNRKSQAL